MKRGLFSILVAGVVLSLAVSVQADTLKTKDGRTFEGRVLKDSAGSVVFEVHRFGATAKMTFRRSQILSIVRGPVKSGPAGSAKAEKKEGMLKVGTEPKAPPVVKYDKPTYYLIPFEGEVGTQVLARYMERSFADALERKPDVVIIVFDSPGGLINEVDKLIAVIKKYDKRIRVVAYVRRALSAAAITGLACKEIYFESQGVFGAATAYKMTSFGLPKAVTEKFQSVWRAQARSAAGIGGHSPLLAEAMIDSSMELHVAKGADGKVIVESGRRGSSGGKTLTTKGKLLTLTAREAVDCSLAKGIVETYDQLGEKMGFSSWVECKGHAAPLAEHWRKSLSAYMKQMRDLGHDFEWNMKKAAESNPKTPNVRYQYYSGSGRFTPESCRRWQTRSREHAAWLLKAEKNIKQAIAVTEELGQLKSVVENLRDLRKHIKSIRMDVQRNVSKTGPDD